MITPKAFRLIIKHFDEIDRIVSFRTVRKRPWLEVALTSLLCDLLDEQTQEDEKLNYSFKELQEDLDKEDSLFGIHLSLETIEFSSNYERYISQSDIGLNLIFENKIEPQYSWNSPYLLQAKRLTPIKVNPLLYTEASVFSSIDKEQQERIEILNRILGGSYLKYLLYCPRPEYIIKETKIKLAYLRNQTLSSHIFDYIIGLEIYKEFIDSNDTLKAGIFVTGIENSSLNFGQVHRGILDSTFPFSWFIALNLTAKRFIDDRYRMERELHNPDNPDSKQIVEGILSGDKKQIDKLIQKLDEETKEKRPQNIQILPKHKITLHCSVGEKINSDMQRLKIE
jgi:hypothetical protein